MQKKGTHMSKVRTLDLKSISFEQHVLAFLSELVGKFCIEENFITISEMGVTFNGTTGTLQLSFDTRENAEEYISKNRANAQSDSAGEFSGHPPDYAFDFYKNLKNFYEFEEWRDWYEGGEENEDTVLEIVDLSGATHSFTSAANYPINDVAVKLLVPIVKKFTASEEFKKLAKSKPFRVGVDTWPDGEMHYWLFENA